MDIQNIKDEKTSLKWCFYNKLISYDKMDVNNKKISASHFYYTASENDYDQYIELKNKIEEIIILINGANLFLVIIN